MSKSTSQLRVTVLHNVVSPHVTPIFQSLAKQVDLTVLYCAEREQNRSWSEKPTGYTYQILKHQEFARRGKDLFTYFINPDILSQLQKQKPQVVIISGWDLLSYQLAWLWCLWTRTPFIIWSGSTVNEPSWRRTVAWPLVKAMVLTAPGFVAYGTRAKEYLIKLGAHPAKITIALNSTRTDLYSLPSATDKKNAEQQKQSWGWNTVPVVLFYGQFIVRKGVDTLLAAMAEVQKELPAALLCVGSGSERAALEQLSQKLALNQVRFLPDPGDEKMKNYYHLADVAVLPSTEEVWGLVVNQAMLCGLPVIVSDRVGSGPDLIVPGQTGSVFAAGDVTKLAQEILKLLRNTSMRTEMGRQAHQKVQVASPEQAAAQLFQAVKTVL